ncbi:MAG: pyruvate ferredoxin oxidoreductase, partial [Chloroflexi bacterium]|nr:pyruvate ferredoxin oxidoreductase [Chloroflexota bacterium]
EVNKYLPPFVYKNALNPDSPVSVGTYGPPIIYTEARKAQEEALRNSKNTILKAWKEFGDLFGRYYSPVETYRTEGAKTVLLTMGSFSETARTAVDQMHKEGKNVGLVRIRMWRPFPFEELREAVKHADNVIVLDRAISYGGPGGPVCSEVRNALYQAKHKPKVISFIGGLGGRDITPKDFKYMVHRGEELAASGTEVEYEMVGVRE